MILDSTNRWRPGRFPCVQVEDEGDLAAVMAAADLDGDGTLNYEEFIAATANLSKLEREDNILAAFKQFDTDHSGALSKAEVMQALVSMGSTEQEVSVRPSAFCRSCRVPLVLQADAGFKGFAQRKPLCSYCCGHLQQA